MSYTTEPSRAPYGTVHRSARGQQFAGEPRDDLAQPGAHEPERSSSAFSTRELLARVVAQAAVIGVRAMDSEAIRIASEHAGERVQFGKPIQSFRP